MSGHIPGCPRKYGCAVYNCDCACHEPGRVNPPPAARAAAPSVECVCHLHGGEVGPWTCPAHGQVYPEFASPEPTPGLRERIEALRPPEKYKNDENGNWWTTDMDYGWDMAIIAAAALAASPAPEPTPGLREARIEAERALDRLVPLLPSTARVHEDYRIIRAALDASPAPEPPKSYWMEFLAWEERAAAEGSGMTAEQKAGAAMFRSWLVNHAPDDGRPEAAPEPTGLDAERLDEELRAKGQ